MKKYVEKNGNTFKISVGYEVGGRSMFSSQVSERGYYLYVQPVSVGRDKDGNVVSESFGIFDGYKMLLKGVNRQSKKHLQEAVDKSSEYVDEMIDRLIKN